MIDDSLSECCFQKVSALFALGASTNADWSNSASWSPSRKFPQEKPQKEVAQKCLGQMGHARAAGALRACLEQEPEAAKESQLPVRANTRLGKCASF